MTDIDVGSLLSQMRSLAAQAQSLGSPPTDASGAPTTGGGEFAQVLNQSIDAVNQAQSRASALAEAFESGTSDVDLAEVMISLQKADLSFKAMTEVRNKLVSAYQEIMNMPV